MKIVIINFYKKREVNILDIIDIVDIRDRERDLRFEFGNFDFKFS